MCFCVITRHGVNKGIYQNKTERIVKSYFESIHLSQISNINSNTYHKNCKQQDQRPQKYTNWSNLIVILER